jgi:hypothetical protein
MTLAADLSDIGFDPDDLLTMDGYDDCIAGVVERIGQEPIICYDRDRVVGKLWKNSSMDYQDAVEFFEFNQLGSHVGELTPCFLTRLEEDG